MLIIAMANTTQWHDALLNRLTILPCRIPACRLTYSCAHISWHYLAPGILLINTPRWQVMTELLQNCPQLSTSAASAKPSTTHHNLRFCGQFITKALVLLLVHCVLEHIRWPFCLVVWPVTAHENVSIWPSWHSNFEVISLRCVDFANRN
mgnify:CR=1 FL=1